MIDTDYRIETPEGIDLTVRPAGVPVRFLAYLTDFLIRALFLLAAIMALSWLGKLGVALLLLLWFVLEWFYPVLFEVLNHGMTPGKQRLGIQVLHDDGSPVGWGASILRNLLRFLDFLPVFYGAGLVCMGIDPRFRRLGDLAAGTVVAYRDEAVTAPEVPEVAPRPVPVALSREEHEALVAFAERYATLTPERRRELADILAPLTDARGEESVRRLQQMARSQLSE